MLKELNNSQKSKSLTEIIVVDQAYKEVKQLDTLPVIDEKPEFQLEISEEDEKVVAERRANIEQLKDL